MDMENTLHKVEVFFYCKKINERKNTMDNQILLTVKETANVLRVNVNFVYALINAGLLPALKLGSLKIRRESVINFLTEYEGMDLSDLKTSSN
jgi:excisionase family DNA binding protein